MWSRSGLKSLVRDLASAGGEVELRHALRLDFRGVSPERAVSRPRGLAWRAFGKTGVTRTGRTLNHWKMRAFPGANRNRFASKHVVTYIALMPDQMRSYLDFEKPVAELEAKVDELRALAASGSDIGDEIARIEDKASQALNDPLTPT